MLPLNLPAISVNPDVTAEVRAGIEAESDDPLYTETLVEMILDLHSALYKAQFAAGSDDFEPLLGVVVQNTIVQVVEEAMRLGAERYVFKHVLRIPDQEE